MLTEPEILRFNRHFPLIGIEGQTKLKNAKILCIGAGGLGCPSLLYLAAAGIGEIGIVDGDQVEIHNLHRQILYSDKDLGKNKAECAKEFLMARQPGTSIRAVPVFINSANATEIIENYDVVLDGTDNYDSRYLINYFCKKLNKPLISASIFQHDAQVGVFNYQGGPCYQCLYPELPPKELIPNCGEAGVLGVLPGVAGILQASEAIKVILNTSLPREFLSFNLLSLDFRRYSFYPNPNCPACQGILPVSSQSQPTCQITASKTEAIPCIEPHELKKWLTEETNLCLLDVRQPYERELYHIGGISIPLQQLDKELFRLPRNVPIVCYCRAGPRSFKAAETLKREGFSPIFVLQGGVLNWIVQLDPQTTTV